MRITESKLRQLIRESILLTEAVTLDEAETKAKKSIMGVVRGKLWDMEKDGKLVALNEEQASWLKEYAPVFIEIAVRAAIVETAIGRSKYNNDLPGDKVGDVFNWANNQLFEKMKDNPDHLSSSLEKAINKVVAFAKLSGEKRMPFPMPDFHPVVNQIKNNWFFSKNTMDQLSDERAMNLKSTIENYYQMLRFINPAKKRNIYDVDDIK